MYVIKYEKGQYPYNFHVNELGQLVYFSSERFAEKYKSHPDSKIVFSCTNAETLIKYQSIN